MPLGGVGYSSVPGMLSPEKLTACLGLSQKELEDLTDPSHGPPRAPTNNEMKCQAELAQKVNMQRDQACMMQQ